jgi:hypothetical protein
MMDRVAIIVLPVNKVNKGLLTGGEELDIIRISLMVSNTSAPTSISRLKVRSS